MPIVKRDDTYWLDVTINRKRIRKTLNTGDRRVAQQRAKELEQALWAGTTLEQPKAVPTLKEAFVELQVTHWQGTKDYAGVCSRFETLATYLDPSVQVSAIDQCVIDSLVLKMKQATYTKSEGGTQYPYSPTTINRVLSLLGYILNRMADKGLVAHVPKLPKAKERGRTRYLTESEEDALFEALEKSTNPNHHHCLRLFEFLVDTGCRMGEVRSLRWTCVDLKNRTILLKDTKSGHDVLKGLTMRAMRALQAERESGQVRPFGGIGEMMYRNAWDYAKKMIGLEDDTELVRHSLRHTTATRLVQSSVPLLDVQAFLGHRNFQTTLKYTHGNSLGSGRVISVLEGVTESCQKVQTESQGFGHRTYGLNSQLDDSEGILDDDLKWKPPKSLITRTVNPQVPGSNPGRGAR